jgi:hypothetical protein
MKEPQVKMPIHLFATIGSLTERVGRITRATSGLSDGDRIVETPQSTWGVHLRDGETVAGLFEPAY